MKNLVDAIQKFNGKKILVMGDIILDKFTWGKIDSLNPEQPASPKVRINPEATYALGGAANVANNITSLGAQCTLYGLIGRDYSGKRIKELCDDARIVLRDYYDHSPTIMKERIMAHNQQVVRLDHGEWKLGKIDSEIQEKILKDLEKEITNYDFIIFSDYNKVFFSEEFAQQIISLANSRGILTLVDTKPTNFIWFKRCTIIRPNQKEAEIVTGIKYSLTGNVLLDMAKRISEIVNPQHVVITCGEDGVFSYDRSTSRSSKIETKARKVADVTGAGDTFAATLALGLCSKLCIEDAVRLANYAAGVVVEKIGTATPTSAEILKRIEQDK